DWRPILFEQNLPFTRYLEIILLAALFLLVIFALAGLYRPRIYRGHFVKEFFQIAIAISAGFLILLLYIFLSQRFFDSRFILIAAWLLAIGLVGLARTLIRGLQNYLVGQYDFGVDRVLLIGNDQAGMQIKHWADKLPQRGYRIVKQLVDLDLSQIEELMGNSQIDAVILANLDFPYQELLVLIDFCVEHRLRFQFAPTLLQSTVSHIETDTLGAVPLIEIKKTSLDGWGKIVKRVFDIVFSFIFLIIFAPVILIIILAIKWDSAGPIMVKLKRVSQGEEFGMYKFRSMVRNAHQHKVDLMAFNERADGPLFKMKNDPRITRVGRFIRRHHLDEIAQIFNVLRGQMSLVGPRPHEPEEVAHYQKNHRQTLFLKSGITGLAQINGASDLSFEQEVKLDTYYIENWSLGLDLKILTRTFLKFFRDPGAT
ncbi:MAG: undecaprenyl-phosphate glucose phosphotransferase, partial [Candidatus Portnoybacteria bacterium CG_4_10_14_0_2_um_filter_39_11]